MKDHPDHTDEKAMRIAYLVAGFIKKNLTVAEHDELDAWIVQSDTNMRLFEEWTDEKNMASNQAMMKTVNTEEGYQKLTGKLNRRSSWLPWVAAAAVLTAIATGIVLTKQDNPGKIMAFNNTIQPGTNKATLSLPGGKIIVLDTAKDGIVLTGLNKTREGELVYAGDAAIGIHTLQTPVGGQYKVQLEDGTMVWLNASSKLVYPAQFDDAARNVTLEGEGYFEVAKDSRRPFSVTLAGGNTVQVLGTHFNVMTYENETSKQVTLVEGKISLQQGNKSTMVLPGQQFVYSNSEPGRLEKVDTEEATGWTKGKFVFRNEPIEAIMRQLERWYDIKVIMETKQTDLFNATMDRKESIDKILHVLELTGKLHFKTENKTVYVLP